MTAGNGIGKDSPERSWKFFRDREPVKEVETPGSATPPGDEADPWHLDQARGVTESLGKEYVRLMEEYTDLRRRILKLEIRVEQLQEMRRGYFRIHEACPRWGKTPSGEREPPGTGGRGR